VEKDRAQGRGRGRLRAVGEKAGAAAPLRAKRHGIARVCAAISQKSILPSVSTQFAEEPISLQF